MEAALPKNPERNPERLSVVEGMPTPTQGAPRTSPSPDDLGRLTELLARRALDNGKYAREHGEYINGLSVEFAKQLVELGRRYSGDVLAAEGRRTTQLKQALGNVDRGPASQQG